jgi:lipopolysaccharide transport system ATP-binding protein
MATPIIKIENLSKIYRLGQIGTGTLRDDYKRWIYKIRGKEDPFLKIGESNDRNKKGNSDYIYALKDINLEVMPGEILGIIGKNGAGKSSLLKILSKVTGPTTGSISYNGRIGSLLEVGTGFHPELTGRENIFLNGAILGMTKTEIKSKFDEIVDFSGVERYIDTPVKRYSSGMMVRLGFAVAAHLEPEILVVDEVLAVGDAEFQKKAIGKMQDVSKNEGRTVLFVSHNMAAVKQLCTRAIMLEGGNIGYTGNIHDTINRYLSRTYAFDGVWKNNENKNHPIIIEEIHIVNIKEEITTKFRATENIIIKVYNTVKKECKGTVIAVNLHSADGAHVMSLEDIDQNPKLFEVRKMGGYITSFNITQKTLNYGKYTLRVSTGEVKKERYQNIHELGFEIINLDKNPLFTDHRKGYIYPQSIINTTKY